MNGKRAKWLNKLVALRNPVLLALIRNEYGERTKQMSPRMIYKAAKELWRKGKIQEVKGWPSQRELLILQKSLSKKEK
jgi:hypothetical protein